MRSSFFVHVLTATGLALSLLSAVSEAYIFIQVNYDGQANDSYLTFEDDQLFSDHFANVPGGGLTGHLFEPTPRNACSSIPPPPSLSNDSWFALVSDYPACPSQMVTNVHNVGYKLIITYNDSHRDLSHEVFDTGFPVISVTEDYAQYLKNYTLSNSTEDPITLTVEANLIDSIVLVAIIAGFVVFFSCFFCCLGVVCCRFYSRSHDRQMAELNARRRNLATHNRRERLARQELIQSILRQLQELQLDMTVQRPLDSDEINQLPTRPYTGDEEEPETCAICISDFTSGESVRVLPCAHIFHPQCIDEWLTGHSSLCPLCKAEVRGADEGAQLPSHLQQHSMSEDSDSVSSDEHLLPNVRSGEPSRSTYGSV